jgi:uncharacterized protein (DUF305 family)
VPRRIALPVVLLLVLGTGCATNAETGPGGGGSSAGASAGSPESPGSSQAGAGRNETDEAYVHELSAMHQQAISMVAMVSSKEVSDSVRDLADEIGRSRSEEAADLARTQRRWGLAPHADYHGNPGELTMRQMSDLYDLDGAEFEEQWLLKMAANHRTAVAMSQAEVDSGLDLAVRELARSLVKVQGAHLDALEQLAG